MTLSKKHYVAFAEILKISGANDVTVKLLADYFAEDNSRFDRERFSAAVE